MRDDRIYDAINLFAQSTTGRGHANVLGDAEHQARYRRLTNAVLTKLWTLWSENEIGYVNPRRSTPGEAGARKRGYRIPIDPRLEPPKRASSYKGAAAQGKVAGTSCRIVREAARLTRGVAANLEDDVLRRTVQALYVRDLMSTVSYQSRITGTTCTARFLPTTPFYIEYRDRMNRFLSPDLIDTVFGSADYRRDLEAQTPGGDAAADFIARSLGWWHGLENRWPGTRGHYLLSLTSREGRDHAEEILEILESLTLPDWLVAKSSAGDVDRIRRGLASGNHLDSAPFARRIARVQSTLREDFGVLSPGRQ